MSFCVLFYPRDYNRYSLFHPLDPCHSEQDFSIGAEIRYDPAPIITQHRPSPLPKRILAWDRPTLCTSSIHLQRSKLVVRFLFKPSNSVPHIGPSRTCRFHTQFHLLQESSPRHPHPPKSQKLAETPISRQQLDPQRSSSITNHPRQYPRRKMALDQARIPLSTNEREPDPALRC